MSKDIELQNKIEEFKKNLENKFEDEKFKNDFDKLVGKIEKLVNCNIKVDIDVIKKFENEFKELGINVDDSNMFSEQEMNDYWNRYNTILRELNEYNIDIEDRSIYYSFEIVEETPFFLETKIKTIEKLTPVFDNSEEKYINLHINSYGGDAYGMFGSIDVIRLSEIPIKGIVKGQVMSAGAYILIGCHHRVMSKNSFMMLHDIQSLMNGAFRDIKTEFDQIFQMQKKIYQFLDENSKMDYDWWENKLQRNVYLSAEEAFDLGLIDEII